MNAIRNLLREGVLEASWAERVGWVLLHSLWQIALIASLIASTPPVASRKFTSGM